MPTIQVKNFSEALARNKREATSSKFAYSQNFDIISYPNLLKPFRGMVANETTTYGLTDFLYGTFGTGIGTNILAFGRQVAADRPEIYMKSGDIVTSGWTTACTTTGSASKTRTALSNLWHLYKNYAYFASSDGWIGRVGDLSTGTSATVVDNHFDTGLTIRSVTQAITHPKDDRMYFGVNNVVYYRDGSSTIAVGITLPTYLTITSVTDYGNFLAIACKPTDLIGNSVVYLWDRDTTLTTVTESIDWGSGALDVLENVGGNLVGVSLLGGTSLTLNPRIVVKEWLGGKPQTVIELMAESVAIDLRLKKYKSNDVLYFGAKIQLNGTVRNCIFAVGKNPNGTMVVTGDINIDNDTALTGNIEGFVKFEDIWFVAFNGDGSVNRTISDGSYSGTSIYQSTINPGAMPEGDRHKDKKMDAMFVTFEPLPTAGQVVLKYKVDGASYSTVFTQTTNGAVISEATINEDSTEFASGRDFEFQIESTGGAVVTGYGYRYTTLPTQI